jgi:hypothetical protein
MAYVTRSIFTGTTRQKNWTGGELKQRIQPGGGTQTLMRWCAPTPLNNSPNAGGVYMASIKSRVIISFVITLLATFGIIATNYLNLSGLAKMQDEGAKRAQAAVDVKEASMAGLALYHVIADAMVDYNPGKSAKDWAKKKAEALKYLDLAIKATSNQKEKKQAEEIKASILEIINLFELKMQPALKSGRGVTAEIKELYDKIDVQADKVESGMDMLVASLQRKMQASDVEFDTDIRLTKTQSMIIGVSSLLLQVWLVLWLLRKKMDKRLEELEETKDRVTKLEGIIPICMYCKKIRDDNEIWNQLEQYISNHSEAMFSHGICPNCLEEKYPVKQTK